MSEKQLLPIRAFVKDKLEKDAKSWASQTAFPQAKLMHFERVINLCHRIAKSEDPTVNIEALEIAALLHDVTVYEEPLTEVRHSIGSAKLAFEFLLKEGFDEEMANLVKNIILAHGYHPYKESATIEEKVLHDADLLDHIGPASLAINYLAIKVLSGQKIEDVLQHFERNRKTIIDISKVLLTKTAKEMSEDRLKFTIEFFGLLEKENKGII